MRDPASHSITTCHRRPPSIVGVALVFLALSALVTLIPFDRARAFTDVTAGALHTEAIMDLAGRGMISGFEDGSFRPDGTVTRQQLAKMIVLAVGLPVSEQDLCAFTDVPHRTTGLYPYHYVAVAAKNGLLRGYNGTSFGPLDQTTREQLITIVARAAESLLRDPPNGWRGAVDTSDRIHGNNIQRAEYAGLLVDAAKDLGTWDTDRPATRGEVAQLLHNFLARVDYRPALSVTNYGAKHDGTTDDILAIQTCVHAAAKADRDVYIPAGTYLITSEIWLPTGDPAYCGMSIRGAGVDKTILTMPKHAGETYMFTAVNLTGLSLSDMTFHTPVSDPPGVCAINARGMQDSSIKRVHVENVDYGFKLGSGSQAHGWTIEDISSSGVGVVSLFLAHVSDSTFTNLDLNNRTDSGRGMCLYVERENHNLAFTNLTCRGGSKYTVQLYNGYGTEPSDHISFVNTVIDATNARHSLAISGGFADITFDTLRLTQTATDMACINFYDPSRVTITDITASGGPALITCSTAPSYPTACVIRRGTYMGPAIGSVPGVTVTDVTHRPSAD